MTQESKRLAGLLLILLPTVETGGMYLLSLLMSADPSYLQNPVRQNLFRAGHAHAGVLLILSLLVLRYVDEARLPSGAQWYVRLAVPSSAIFIPGAFFFSVLSPTVVEPNGFIYLAYVGAFLLATGLITLGVGLLRPNPQTGDATSGA